MPFFNSSTPKLEFASLTLLYELDSSLVGGNGKTEANKHTHQSNQNYAATAAGNDDENDVDPNNNGGQQHSGGAIHDTFHEITSVTSPLATASPQIVRDALNELHDHLSGTKRDYMHIAHKKGRGKDASIVVETKDQKDSNNYQNNCDNHSKQIDAKSEEETSKKDDQKETSESPTLALDHQDADSNVCQRVNDNDFIQCRLPADDAQDDTIGGNDSNDVSSSFSPFHENVSLFQAICTNEERSFYSSNNLTSPTNNNESSPSSTPIQTGSKNVHGYTIHYKIMTHPQIIQHCLTYLNPHMNPTSLKAFYNPNMAVVLCVGVAGMEELYHLHPQVYDLFPKMDQFASEFSSFLLSPSLSTTTITSTSTTTKSIPKIKTPPPTSIEKRMEERHEIELLLMSILLDDESIKTNTDVELEKGNFYSIHQQLQQQQQHLPNQSSIQSKLSLSASPFNTTKSSSSNNTTKFLLKKKFQKRINSNKRKMKKFFGNHHTTDHPKHKRGSNNHKHHEDDHDDDLSEFAATAFLSQSTPSSERTRIISDQMQVLSLAEKGMNLTLYKMTNHDGGGHHGSSTNSSSSSSTRIKNHSSNTHGVKSPMNSKRRGRKFIGSDLSGFDYVPDKKNNTIYPNDRMDNQSIISSQESTIGGGGSSIISSTSSSNRGFAGHQSIGSEITSTTATTISSSLSSMPLSSDSSVTSSSISTVSSSSFIPTLSGPIRDSSLSKKKVRRDKVRKAIEANNQSRSMNYAVSLDNGGMGQSPQRNKVKDLVHNNNGQMNGMSSGFDPFAVDEESEDIQNNNDHSRQLVAPKEQRPNTYSNYDFNAPTTPEFGPPRSPQRQSYVPGSRKLFANVALNEDLSCLYRDSKLSTYSVEGNVQILLKSDSTAFVPFKVALTDVHDHIEMLNENSKYANIVSKEDHMEKDTLGTKFKFMVTLPKYDQFFEILKYKCKSTLIPVPLVSAIALIVLFLLLFE